jgi:hypothetical protein
MIIKSDYKDFLECQRKYALKKLDTPEDEPNFVLARRNELGSTVGLLAHELFEDLIVIPANVPLKHRILYTEEALEKGLPIAEASFSYEDAFCAIDILEKKALGYAIYEVKSNTSVDPTMIDDAAYQTYIALQNGLSITEVYIVHVNNTYLKEGDIDPHQYFTTQDITEDVFERLDIVPETLDHVRNQALTPPFKPISACKECPFHSTCYSALPEDSMVKLYNYRKKTKMYEEGVRTLDEYIHYDPNLNDIQKRQIDFYYEKDPKPYLNPQALFVFMKQFTYPVYYLDFETLDYVIPIFDHSAPNEKLPFQASIHREEAQGSPLKHTEFLMDTDQDPRIPMIEYLLETLKDEGSIIVYHQTFEKGVIKILAERFPQYEDPLLKLLDRIIDLKEPFTKGMVYHKEMGNSFSIKSVYPAMVPDQKMAYKNLDTVHNGSEAMQVLEALPRLKGDDYQLARTQLLEYCKLDTLSMVEITHRLFELLDTQP